MDAIQHSIARFLYEACGNTFIIVPMYMTPFSRENNLKHNKEFLCYLVELFHQNEVDSMLVLQGNLDEREIPEMHVFEPRGQEKECAVGSWSVMCGNGVRAVAQYLIDNHRYDSRDDIHIKTGSGILNAHFSEKGIDVAMGYGSFEPASLQKFIRMDAVRFERDFIDVHMPNYPFRASIGCVGFPDTSGIIHGEPHCLVAQEEHLLLEDLEQKCLIIGTKLTIDDALFFHEMNTNCFSVQRVDHQNKVIHVHLCTYERGVYKVTPSCGTGATTLASYLYQTLDVSDAYAIEVKNIGGMLSIRSIDGVLHSCGHASRMIS